MASPIARPEHSHSSLDNRTMRNDTHLDDFARTRVECRLYRHGESRPQREPTQEEMAQHSFGSGFFVEKRLRRIADCLHEAELVALSIQSQCKLLRVVLPNAICFQRNRKQ